VKVSQTRCFSLGSTQSPTLIANSCEFQAQAQVCG